MQGGILPYDFRKFSDESSLDLFKIRFLYMHH